MTRILLHLMVSAVLATVASADQYWIAYEGNDFPENEGWTRLWNGPIAERWIEDGALVIDARESGTTCEWYNWYPDTVGPDLGELFLLQWRVKVEDVSGDWIGVNLALFSDDCWGVGFYLTEDTIRSAYEPGVSAQFEPDEFHHFELRSSDMRSYHLYIDGAIAIEGSFWEALWSNKVLWGKSSTGTTCLSSWDYFRFGVVPEPSAGLTVIALLVAFVVTRNSRG
ncbi:MAG: hypothetical protein JSW71_05520 [Gemmatimonadota bacterium]|nr:MAG: hypothetical protein JSW71_05520 [Gemmatimonadota bacterium]